jgi:hypothetical protein
MAAGFRSMAAFWIGGIATGAATPEPSCPCPPWTQEQTLLNAFSQRLEASTNSFKSPQTLTNQWVRKNCD